MISSGAPGLSGLRHIGQEYAGSSADVADIAHEAAGAVGHGLHLARGRRQDSERKRNAQHGGMFETLGYHPRYQPWIAINHTTIFRSTSRPRSRSLPVHVHGFGINCLGFPAGTGVHMRWWKSALLVTVVSGAAAVAATPGLGQAAAADPSRSRISPASGGTPPCRAWSRWPRARPRSLTGHVVAASATTPGSSATTPTRSCSLGRRTVVKKKGEQSIAGVVFPLPPTNVGRNRGRSSTRISAFRSSSSRIRSRCSTSRTTKSAACA